MQELLRHSSLRSTLEVYTQAVTPAKHAAQAAVLSLVFSSNEDDSLPGGNHCQTARTKALRKRRTGRKRDAKRALFASSFGFNEIGLTLLERMAGTTRLELAVSAVTGGNTKYLQ